MLFGIGVLLFWGWGFPHALSYHEQYQLFLWTGDYFVERLSVPGGLADWLGEFITQFYYHPWAGAALLALLFVILQRGVAALLPPLYYLLSFIPPLLLLWHMGNVHVLLSYAVALTAVTLLAKTPIPSGWVGVGAELLFIPVLYWLIGPMVWLYAALCVVLRGWRWSWLLVWVGVSQLLLWATILEQWPQQMVMFSISYFMIPMQVPVMQWVIPLIMVVLVLLGRIGRNVKLGGWMGKALQLVLVVSAGWLAYSQGFERETYELVWQDCQVRYERWDKIIKRAGEHVVMTPFWSNSVNLALSQKRLLADRMFDFYQSGEDALLMSVVRDQTSNMPTAEACFRLGLVNSAQRYMFNMQESIFNGKKSGRCTKRIVECMLVNGHYKPALKYIDLLEKSLFYRSWAQEARRVVTSDATTREQLINRDPVLGRLRQLRFQDDFLFSHPEKDKIFAMLFQQNHDNKMALDYFLGEELLRGNVQDFMQYLPWAQQYGSYTYMPVGYQDAVQCIQRRGNMPGSRYGDYAKRMMRK